MHLLDEFCLDLNKECAQLATGGMCENNTTFMHELCPLSCGLCGPGIFRYIFK